MSTQVQSVIFEKSKYSVTQAKKWLRDNGFVAPKVDKTDRYLRFRQKQPGYFDESSFRTIPFGKGKGIKAIIGVPVQSNPFYDELDPGGDGHRIGAYAMLFTKAKNEWKRTGDPLELAKAKQYWDQYLHARDQYETIEDREGSKVLLHEMESFENAIQNPKKRNNPMKTHKNPVIDGKTIVANLKGLRKLIGKSIPAREEDVDMAIYKVMTSLEKINDLGIKADMTQRFKGVYKNVSYQIDLFKSSMGEIAVIFTQPKGSQKVKVTIEYIEIFPHDYMISVMKLDDMIDEDRIYGYLVKNDSGSKYLLEKLEEFTKDEEALEEAVYIPEPEPVGISPKEPIDITRGMKNNPHCHCYGHKKNPHCPTHGRKKNPRIDDNWHDLVITFMDTYLPPEWHQHSLDDIPDHVFNTPFQRKMKALMDRDYERDFYNIDDYKVLMKKNPMDTFSLHKRPTKGKPVGTHFSKMNPYGTAFRHGHMSGLAYRYNPTKKIMDFESFMDNLADGNVFVGRYVIFVQDGVPMRLEVGSSTPKEVSPEVAFYADLAGQAELVGTSDIDAFSDDYRGLIRQASDASSGGAVAGGTVPVVEVEEVEEVVIPPSAPMPPIPDTLEQLAELEAVFENAQNIKTEWELDGGSSKLKYLLAEVLRFGTRDEKEVISRLQVLADSKRAKSPKTLTEKILKRYIKMAEKSMGAKIEMVDDDTGRKTTPEKEAEQIVEEAQEEVVAPSPAPSQGGVDPNQALMDMLRSIGGEIDAARKKSEEAQAQFKNNPRDSHYAYNMSTLDHNHRMSYVPLNNVYIKKNPSDAFRFPQTKVLGVDIDNDIYRWLSSLLPNWSSISQKLEKVKDLAVNIQPVIMDMIINLIQNVASLKANDDKFMVRMQTEIVPAVEAKVKKQLASGKTLKDIIGKAKKNPTRRMVRRNTKRRRRYY